MTGATSTLEAPQPATSESRIREADLLAALPARTAKREVRVGLFVLLGIVAFLTALFTLTDVGTFRGRYYATTIIENAGGMRNGDPVQMRGVNIGRVTDFRMVPDGVAVTLEIYNRYEIPEDSHVAIRSAGLLGGVVVDVVPGESAERVSRNQILPGSVETDILASAGSIGEQAELVLDRASDLLSTDNIGALGASAADLQRLLNDLSALAAQQREEVASLTQSLRRSSEAVERTTTGPELERVVTNLDATLIRLEESSRTLAGASGSLELILGRLERGEGTLGRLTTDDALYENLNAAAAALESLMTDIQEDPRKYLNIRVF